MSAVKEAEAILLIAKTLEPYSKSKACAIMAITCLGMDEYEKAAEFSRLAAAWKQSEVRDQDYLLRTT